MRCDAGDSIGLHRKSRQYTLLARAKDAGGAFQPDEHDQNYGVYVSNHSLPIEVFVDDPGAPRP